MIEEDKQFENHESPAVAAPDDRERIPEAPDDREDAPKATDNHQTPEAAVTQDSDPESAPTAAEETAATQAALAQMAQEVASLRGQLEERNNLYIRIAADFENFRKRTAKEKEEIAQKVKRDTLSELLPVVDNFERARAQIKTQTDAELTIKNSYQGVYKQLVEGFKKIGVAPMRPEGQPFDPNLHEAVMREATTEQPEGTVLEELVRGYLLGDRVLRHALVKVATAPEPAATSEEDA